MFNSYFIFIKHNNFNLKFRYHGNLQNEEVLHGQLNSEVKTMSMPDLWSNDLYYTYMNSLNNGQQIILHNIVARVQKGEIFNIFLTGPGGTGKSRVLKAVYQTVCRMKNPNPDSNVKQRYPVILGAFTGKAAQNVGGQTLHTLFGLPMGAIKDMSPDLRKKFLSKFEYTVLIIIDEISLCGYRSFYNLMMRFIQYVGIETEDDIKKKINISFLVIGDFRQIKAVKDEWIFENQRSPETFYECFLLNFFWPEYELYELTEIMRQRDDLKFAEILTTIGDLGVQFCSPDEIILLDSRIKPMSEIPTDAIILTYANKDVNAYNRQRLMGLKPFRQKAFDFPSGKGEEIPHAIAICRSLYDKKSEVESLHPILNLVVGQKYMITTNINTSDGLVNGTIGTLMLVIYNKNTNIKYIYFIL